MTDTQDRRMSDTEFLFIWTFDDEYPTTFTLFLDLIGWSDAFFGKKFVEETPSLSVHKAKLLGDALRDYSKRPTAVWEFVTDLMMSGQPTLSFDNPHTSTDIM